ncbi:CRE-PFN-1 protein, partial [Aphelenchoides avenae]
MSSTSGWVDYVNVLVNETDCIKRAAIIGYADATVWACSEDFKPVGEELHHLVHQFSNRVVPRIAHLEGVPFLVSRAHPTCIQGYKSQTTFHALKRNK